MSSTVTAPMPERSGNPALNERFVTEQLLVTGRSTMSVAGVGIKTIVLLAVVIAGGVWGWASATVEVPEQLGSGVGDTVVVIPGGFWLASIAALFIGIFISLSPRRAAVLGALYAVCQGFCLGAISAAYDAQTEGIVGAAVLSTLCVFTVALFLYVTGIVKPSRKMAFAVTAGIGGLCLLYLFVWVLAIFDWSWLYSESFRTVGIIVTTIAVILAAMSLMLDFGTIEAGVRAGAPKDLEWYLAFGLMVTLIWLYVELLRLIALLGRNR